MNKISLTKGGILHKVKKFAFALNTEQDEEWNVKSFLLQTAELLPRKKIFSFLLFFFYFFIYMYDEFQFHATFRSNLLSI